MKPHRLLRHTPVVFLLISIVVQGCTVIKKKIDATPGRQPSSFAIVQTHFYDVLDTLGPPAQITPLPEGFAFLYESLLIQENQFGISLGKDSLSLFKFCFGDTNVDRATRIMVFDKSGYLRSYSNSATHEDAGNAFAFQFLFGIVPMVDTLYLENNPSPLYWGFSQLNPLPQALQSADNWMEQRGTPTGVGQRTLEMQTGGKKKGSRLDKFN